MLRDNLQRKGFLILIFSISEFFALKDPFKNDDVEQKCLWKILHF